ncbi:hypothetical protein Tco_0835153, partial [Tanacetum coccineum]
GVHVKSSFKPYKWLMVNVNAPAEKAPAMAQNIAKASKSQQTKFAPAKPQEKKRKLVTEISEAPSPAKRSKARKVTKKRKPKSPLQLIDEFVDEVNDQVPVLLGISTAPCQGKGKEKVSDEQVALDLLTLQTPKKKSPTEQYIFQRRTSTPTESSGHDESSSLYAELGLTVSETESDEEVRGTQKNSHRDLEITSSDLVSKAVDEIVMDVVDWAIKL